MGTRSTARRGLALALAAVVLAAVPARMLVDAAVPDRRAHVESTHDPARCGYLHDHAACQQLFASAASPTPAAAADRLPPSVGDRLPPRSRDRDGRPGPSDPLPRAPPHLRS